MCKIFAASLAAYQAAQAVGKGVAPDDGTYEWTNPATGEVHDVPNGIDPGWGYNVGTAQDWTYKILGDKFEELPNDIARAWMAENVQGPAFERFVEGKITTDFPVAVLDPADMTVLDAQSQTVWMSQTTLLDHLDKHPDIGLEDYRLIPEILDQGEVYKQDDQRLVYLKRGDKLYRAGLKRTADGMENYFLTLFETTDARAKRQVVSKYEKVR